jgi:stage II sporulation protein D
MSRSFCLLSCLVLAFFSVNLRAAEIKIGLYHDSLIESVVFSTVEGEYLLIGDGRQVAVIKKGTIFHIEQSGSRLSVNDTAQSYGLFSEIAFRGVSQTNIFQIKPVFPSLGRKESDGDLTIRIFQEAMQIINSLELEKYIPGTVESEGGSTALPEYYKSQAVIARTYALKNFHRHAHEGFNLCDGVHCQAYNGKSRMNREIYKATLETQNLILAGNDGNPVATAYHANCGGITGSASVAWNRELYYMVPVHDPFCNKSSLRNWQKTIPLSEWITYLKLKGLDSEQTAFTTSPDGGRQKFLDPGTKMLLLTHVREDFNLKSSFLYIEINAGSLIFHGHGYGHGLGLCQQGAMEMARVGYTYIDILMFYFRGLQLKEVTPTPDR